MNPLLDYFENNKGRLIHKWMHYFDIYHRHFSRFREQHVTIVEFGVYHGGSLQMWKNYFGSKARIIGIDINPDCKSLEEDQIQIHIGDQEDGEFLNHLISEIGEPNILIDDGGHTMGQQITTFEYMFPAVSESGVYLVEDLHTSYMPEYGGGYKKFSTFIEYSKNFIDAINAWHSRQPNVLHVTEFTRTAASLHYYDSVLVIEKGTVIRPMHKMTGTPSFKE